MRIEILGAGGALTVPRPFCSCRICEEAREKGVPYTRYGPSVFLHGPDLLIDTPEEISVMLNRSRIMHVESVLYSHWHPDHTAGIRVWESNLNSGDPFAWPFKTRQTHIYLPENVAETFDRFHDLATKCRYLESFNVVSVERIPTEKPHRIGDLTVTPITLAELIACGFLITRRENDVEKRILVCMDETFAWTPPAWLGPLDLAILPAGIFEFNPLTGERHIPADNPILQREITYDQTLVMLRHIQARRVVFIHLSEPDGLTRAEYEETARRQNAARPDGFPPVTFAYDTMMVEV